jgi:acyl-[acyl-carrier-protein]-phospholipid O-acyltransferase/long-chain-fatty-acid--[acyl-carrier-protein] ligase
MNRSFWLLLGVQSQVIFNDNAAKLTLIALAMAVLPSDQSAPLKNVFALIAILPFVLFSPLVGWISDRFSKRNVLIYSLWLQAGIMLMVIAGIVLKDLWVAGAAFFILGLQVAVFSPAKQGITRELVGARKLTAAVAWMEMAGICSILLGSLGGLAFDWFWRRELDRPWHAGFMTFCILMALALAAVGACHGIEKTPRHAHLPFRWSLLWEHFHQIAEGWKSRPIRLCILGNGYFYALAGAVYLTLWEAAQQVVVAGPGLATQTGIYMAMLGVGIVIGAVLVNFFTPHHIELGLIPIGSFGMIGATLVLGLTDPAGPAFHLGLVILGLGGALFLIPLNAHLQEVAAGPNAGRTLAASNLVMNLTGVFAVILQYALARQFNLGPEVQFLIYAIPTLIITLYIVGVLPESLLRFVMACLARLIYRVRASGTDTLPATGGVLLLPNHISYVDAIVLQLACPRPIRFVIYDPIYRIKWLNWGLRLLRAIPIHPKRAKGAIDSIVEALRQGEVVCLFPEGMLTRTAGLQKLSRGYELIAERAAAPVVPVWLDNLWGSVFSYSGGKLFWKKPKAVPYAVSVFFGKPLAPAEAKVPRVRQTLYDLGSDAFEARPELASHLGYECLKGLQRKFSREVVINAYQGGRVLTGGKLLAVSLAFAEWVKKNVPEKRVGIVLPPGIGACIANLACVLCDKTPVNLNFTAGRAANEAALQRGQIRSVLTAEAIAAKLKDFPWPENKVDLAEVLKATPKSRIVRWLVLARILPSGWLRRLAGVPRSGDRAEVALLFTSGSAGEPKGVVLSHRNILANTAQIEAILGNADLHRLLGCLPIFHSFGCTVTFWWPMLGAPAAVTYPVPTETAKLAEIIEKYGIRLMLNTPTFLRAYLRKAKPEQLKSLKMIVTGAEKLPLDLLETFEPKFGATICEGYGMTEATPVVAVNLLDPPPLFDGDAPPPGRRIGSVGRLLPGMSARIKDPESGAELTLFESGMLYLKGANVFGGYLGDPARTAEVLRDGWYQTGDIGRMDEDGFLFIEGRMSRFSKIGGEMVPHGTVEQKINEAYGFSDSDEVQIVVAGIPDPDRGEALILLTRVPLEQADVRAKLNAAGLPNLWVPKVVKKVEAIPVLSNGKLDLKACQALAREAAASA